MDMIDWIISSAALIDPSVHHWGLLNIAWKLADAFSICTQLLEHELKNENSPTV